MLTANHILLILSTIIVGSRIMAFFIVRVRGPASQSLKLEVLFRKQPWLPAALILVNFALEYSLIRFHLLAFNGSLDLIIHEGLGAIRALLSIWLLLALANAFYAWLSQVISAQSLVHSLLPYIKNGIRYTFLVLSLPFITSRFPVYPETKNLINKVIEILVIWSVAWLMILIISALEKVTLQRLYESLKEDFHARRIYTQVRVFKRVIIFLVASLALAATAMAFDSIRELGTSILASAGLATIILGLAAQKTLGNLFVGMQIAITQPIRINDTITIENELGTVEEITLSHVILRIWDLRRLIIPISYFIEKPFQNLTRTSTELLSPIFFYADYNLPVESVRKAFMDILHQSSFWDGKVATLQVVEAQGNVIKLRALASVKDNSTSWNLKCEVLEKLIAFIVKNHPQSLPKLRNLSLPSV